jgi:hypothetical protein
MMSSATSTEDPGLHPTTQSPRGGEPGLHPWQFFLLAGMLSATAVVLVSAGQSPASIVALSLTVVAASFVALGAYRALAPLVVPGAAEAPPLIVGQTRAALEREKRLVLRAIKDLEFDYAMKKVARNDFEEMTGRLRARAIGLMRQLDTGGGYRELIEAELRGRLGTGVTGAIGGTGAAGAGVTGRSAAPAPAPVAPAPAAPAPAAPAPAAPALAAPAAPVPPVAPPAACSCGTLNDSDARFCKNCGNKLAV